MFSLFKRNNSPEATSTEQGTASIADSEEARAAAQADKIMSSIAEINQACQDRSAEFQRALFNFEMKMRKVLKKTKAEPLLRRRADNLLRRTFPRLLDAIKSFDDFADNNPGHPDLDENRDRVVAALITAGEQAERIIADDIDSEEQDLDIAISVLEQSFAYNRR